MAATMNIQVGIEKVKLTIRPFRVDPNIYVEFKGITFNMVCTLTSSGTNTCRYTTIPVALYHGVHKRKQFQINSCDQMHS